MPGSRAFIGILKQLHLIRRAEDELENYERVLIRILEAGFWNAMAH